MKPILLLMIFSLIGCVNQGKSNFKVKPITTPVTTPVISSGFRIEIPSTFNFVSGEVNQLLLVVVPNKRVRFQVSNELVANICDSEFGKALCINSIGNVTITATDTNGQSVVKTIEVFGALDFSVDKSSTVTSNDDRNRVNLSVNSSNGVVTFSIDESEGSGLGTIINNQYIPPSRESLVQYLQENPGLSANVFIKAQDERGNSAIKEISVYPSALVDVSRQISLVCDQKNILSNSFFISVDGGLPMQDFEIPDDANLSITKIATRSENNQSTVFKVVANRDCNSSSTHTITLKDALENTISLDVNIEPSLVTSIDKNSYKDTWASSISRSIEGELASTDITIGNAPRSTIELSLNGAIPPYRVFISSPKSTVQDLPQTTTTLKLVQGDNIIPISSNDYNSYQRSDECAPVSYEEGIANSSAKNLGSFNENASIKLDELHPIDGFYRLVIVDCNGVYQEHDFYKERFSLVKITNNYLNAGSPFSTFSARSDKSLQMDLTFLNEQFLENYDSEFSRVSSDDPAFCNGENCLSFVPLNIFDGIDSLEPAKVNIVLTNSVDSTFTFDKYIYPGFQFSYFDRASNQYQKFNETTPLDFLRVKSIDSVAASQQGAQQIVIDENVQNMQRSYINKRLKEVPTNINEESVYDNFLSNVYDIKIEGGIGLVGPDDKRFAENSTLSLSEKLLNYFPELYNLKHNDNSGINSHPYFESCLDEHHSVARLKGFRNNFYTFENGIKNFLVNNASRELLEGQAQKTFYFSSPLNSHFKETKLPVNGIFHHKYFNENLNKFDSYRLLASDDAQEDLSPFDRRILDCFSDNSDPCDFWVENLSFIYPEQRDGESNITNIFNRSSIPWLQDEITQSFRDVYSVAKVKRRMRLGAAINKYNHSQIQAIPENAKIMNHFGLYTTYQVITEQGSKICINYENGYDLGNITQLSGGWELSEDRFNVCHSGVSISGYLLSTQGKTVYYYQTSINSAISKLYLDISNVNNIEVFQTFPNIMNSFRSRDANATYRLVGSFNNNLYVETSYSPSGNYYTCVDSAENTNLIVVKDLSYTGSEFSTTLLNYVPANGVESTDQILNPSNILKTVYRKNENCDFGNLEKGILKIERNTLNSQFYSLSQIAPQLAGEDISKFYVTDYAQVNHNGENSIYIAGVKKDQRNGVERYALQMAAETTREVIHDFDAPFLIKTNANLENQNYKLYERPQVSYSCHRKTEINNVKLYFTDAKVSFPNGNLETMPNLMFDLKGAYYRSAFSNPYYDNLYNSSVGYLALNQHMEMDFFHRLRQKTSNIEFIQNTSIATDTSRITIKEYGRKAQLIDSSVAFVPYAIFSKVQFKDFRDR